MIKKVISIVLCVCLTLMILPISAFAKETSYPYVLVSGLGGWGATSKINDLLPYWGSITGNLANELSKQGYEVVEASVGPFSSTWDRACELYAQLTGTVVDYGEAHSKAHNHARYGMKYDKIIKVWNEDNKINLIGHSFGGETVRLLTSLLAYGDETESAITGDNTSPLFIGGKENWVYSVTTLCSPHNGTTLYYVLDTIPYLIKTILITVGALGMTADKLNIDKFYVFNLGRFNSLPLFINGNDHAGYDLSLHGAKELNKKIKIVDSVYYFSYVFADTHSFGSIQVPNKDIFFLLYLTALGIGSYSDKEFNNAWRENDGLVPVISAQHPFNEPWRNYDENEIVRGVWNVMHVMPGHHGTIIGMDGNKDEIQRFYIDLIERTNNL